MSERLLQVLSEAMEMENKIRGFYLDAIGKVRSEFARDALSFLAEQELVHIQDIKAYQAKLADVDMDFDLESIVQKSSREQAKVFFGSRQEYIKKNTEEYPDDAKLYDVGLDIEREGYKYYAVQADNAEDDVSRKFFEFLKNEEIMHYDLLDRLRTYLTRPGDWFVQEEKWMFDGA